MYGLEKSKQASGRKWCGPGSQRMIGKRCSGWEESGGNQPKERAKILHTLCSWLAVRRGWWQRSPMSQEQDVRLEVGSRRGPGWWKPPKTGTSLSRGRGLGLGSSPECQEASSNIVVEKNISANR